MNKQLTPQEIVEHPHGLLLVVAQQVLLGFRQPSPTLNGVPPYSANPEAFARQMETFHRMRETEREFTQRAKEARP